MSSLALEGNFGGELHEFEVNEFGFIREVYTKNEASAYMLVYIRNDMKDLVLEEVNTQDIPEGLHSIFNSELKRKEEEHKKIVQKESVVSLYLVNNQIIHG